MSTVYDLSGVTWSSGPNGALRVARRAAEIRFSEAGLILSSCRKRTSGQLCRERKARSELCGAWCASVPASRSRIGLKYEVMGAADAGINGCIPLTFQETRRIVRGRGMVASDFIDGACASSDPLA